MVTVARPVKLLKQAKEILANSWNVSSKIIERSEQKRAEYAFESCIPKSNWQLSIMIKGNIKIDEKAH